VGLARGFRDYQYRHDAQCQITADTIRELRNDVEREIWIADTQKYFDGLKMLFVPTLGVAVASLVAIGTIAGVGHCENAQKSTVAISGMFAAVMLAGLTGITTAEVSADLARERARNLHRLERKLSEIQHLEDMQQDLEREKVGHEVVGEILSIMSETRDELREELNSYGPDEQNRKDWAYRKAKWRLESRLEELRRTRDPKDPDDAFATALFAKDPQTCARIFVTYCSRANHLFQPAKAGSAARTASLMKGFAALNLAGTANEPDTMWQ
jgi:hypothetical protein